MKALSPEVRALLKTRQFYACDLVALTLVGGATHHYSAGDCDVVDVDGARYACGGMSGPFWISEGRQGSISQKLGTQADTLTIDLLPGKSTIEGMPWGEAAARGLLRGATLDYRVGLAPAPVTAACWPVPLTGSVREFLGFVGESDGGGSQFVLNAADARQRLQSPWPRNLYSPSCCEWVGSAGCGIDTAPFAVATTAQAGSSGSVIVLTLSQDNGYFDLGSVEITSGANAGLSRSIRSYVKGSPGAITLMTPFPNDPAVGDHLVLHPGCDGSFSPRGCPKFGGTPTLRFRGQPFVPAPTTAGA
ncbi:MAG: DUF2163 domain-containing protein [Magnetospirillum sp.]|nr:DUF2163 domain-containing protein [Magnetospirillum sp.]